MTYDLTITFRQSKSGYYKMAIFMAGKFNRYTPADEDCELNKVQTTFEELKDKYHYFDALWGFVEHWVGTKVYFHDIDYTKSIKQIRSLVRQSIGLDKPKDPVPLVDNADFSKEPMPWEKTQAEYDQFELRQLIMKMSIAQTEWNKTFADYQKTDCSNEDIKAQLEYWERREDFIIQEMAKLRKIQFFTNN